MKMRRVIFLLFFTMPYAISICAMEDCQVCLQSPVIQVEPEMLSHECAKILKSYIISSLLNDGYSLPEEREDERFVTSVGICFHLSKKIWRSNKVNVGVGIKFVFDQFLDNSSNSLEKNALSQGCTLVLLMIECVANYEIIHSWREEFALQIREIASSIAQYFNDVLQNNFLLSEEYRILYDVFLDELNFFEQQEEQN